MTCKSGFGLYFQTCRCWPACLLGSHCRTKLGCLAHSLVAAPPPSKESVFHACVASLARSSWSRFWRSLQNSVLALLQSRSGPSASRQRCRRCFEDVESRVLAVAEGLYTGVSLRFWRLPDRVVARGRLRKLPEVGWLRALLSLIVLGCDQRLRHPQSLSWPS